MGRISVLGADRRGGVCPVLLIWVIGENLSETVAIVFGIALILGALYGLGAGVVAGVPCGVALGLASARGLGDMQVGRRWCRVIGAVVAALAVGACGAFLYEMYEPGPANDIVSGPLPWVVIPAAIAALVFAWRSPAIVNARTPTLASSSVHDDFEQQDQDAE